METKNTLLNKFIKIQEMQFELDKLKKQKHDQFAQEASGSTEGNKHQEYIRMIYNPKKLLNVNKDFLDCPLIDKIRQDIEHYLNRHPVNSVARH